ncbi:MAG: hypothetical protein H7X71_03345 [Chitinophagales bacterium]|nr:hypothetical protein [Chitinophagales bacterium]
MKKIFIILAMAICVPFILQAQTDADALRYSFLDFGGTARSLGSANAYGAIGGDYSTTSMNPAGLGIYRSSELVLTPGLTTINNSSLFIGETNGSDKTDFYLSNASLVLSYMKDGKESATDGWVGANFGVGYNKLANYNSQVYYSGFNTTSSLLDVYAGHLNGVNPSDAFAADPFGAGLAWETYLLNPNPDDSTTYYGVVNGGNVRQSKSINTAGGYDELTISFAGNYANRLYVGGTLGVPFIDYDYVSSYQEEDENEVHPDFVNFSQTDELHTSGSGINVKMGFIYRINDYVRLGGAFHSPTLFQMNDVYFSSMESSLDISGDYPYESPIGEYDYELVTPWRVIGSAALTIQKHGFVSVDYEYVDYSEANFNYGRTGTVAELDAETNVNTSIENKYGSASNIRFGGELVLDVFRLRAGYAIMGSPFNTGIAAGDADYARNMYTAGAGIKEENFFIDFGFGHTTSTAYDIPYLQPNPDLPNDGATTESGVNNFLLSLGFRF